MFYLNRRQFLKGTVSFGLATLYAGTTTDYASGTTLDDVVASVQLVTGSQTVQIDWTKLAKEYQEEYDEFKRDYLKKKDLDVIRLLSADEKKGLEEEWNSKHKHQMLIPEETDEITIAKFLMDYYRDKYDLDVSKEIEEKVKGSAIILDGKENNSLYLLTSNHAYNPKRVRYNLNDKKQHRNVQRYLPVIVKKNDFKLEIKKATIELESPLLASDRLDYALFKLPDFLRLNSFPNRFLDYDNLNIGDKVYLVGIPENFMDPLVRSGIVSAKYFRTSTGKFETYEGVDIDNKHLIILDISQYPGDSGGLFVNDKFQLGGLQYSGFVGKQISVAVRIDSILNDGLAEHINPKYLPK